MDEFNIGELFNKFYGELASKSKLPDTGEIIIFKYFNKLTLTDNFLL